MQYGAEPRYSTLPFWQLCALKSFHNEAAQNVRHHTAPSADNFVTFSGFHEAEITSNSSCSRVTRVVIVSCLRIFGVRYRKFTTRVDVRRGARVKPRRIALRCV